MFKPVEEYWEDKVNLKWVFKQLILLLCQLSVSHCTLICIWDCRPWACSLFLVCWLEIQEPFRRAALILKTYTSLWSLNIEGILISIKYKAIFSSVALLRGRKLEFPTVWKSSNKVHFNRPQRKIKINSSFRFEAAAFSKTKRFPKIYLGYLHAVSSRAESRSAVGL